MNETRELANFIAKIRYEDLNKEVIEKTKGLVLDQLGCELAFASLPWSKSICRYVRSRWSSRQESTVVYYGFKTSAEDAVLANASFGHGFEMDDTEVVIPAHPGAVVISSSLAMGEAGFISGKEFITAIVAGYEAMLRVGMAARTMMKRGFHATAVSGPFGSAAAACKVLGLDAETTLNALGIAASEASGVAECSVSGGSVKRLHAGFPAMSGVRAALLAQFGITSPATALEGKNGFCRGFSEEPFVEDITKDLGMGFRIMTTGNKPYCCCAAQHGVIDATSKIMAGHTFKTEEIDEITVEQRPREVNNVGAIIEPKDIINAQFSARFGVALRLIKGGNGFLDYNEDNLHDPEILGLARRIKYVADEKYERLKVEGAPAIVTLKLKNGAVYSEQVNYAKGTLQNPMTGKDLELKFRDLVAKAISPRKTDRIVETIDRLEDLDNIQELAALLVADGEK